MQLLHHILNKLRINVYTGTKTLCLIGRARIDFIRTLALSMLYVLIYVVAGETPNTIYINRLSSLI